MDKRLYHLIKLEMDERTDFQFFVGGQISTIVSLFKAGVAPSNTNTGLTKEKESFK
jgi:hypothetical protein